MPYRFSDQAKRSVTLDVTDLIADGSSGASVSAWGASVSFCSAGVEPSSWVPARWVTSYTDPLAQPGYGLTVLVGPDDGQVPHVDQTLAVGNYYAWAKVNSGTEVYVDQLDSVTITGAGTGLVLTVDEMATYMGYPFQPDQVQAVEDVIASVTAEVQTRLRADLTRATWTELYMVPWEQGTPFMNAFIGVDYGSLYPNSDAFNLSQTVSVVRLQHWPVTQWVSLAVNTSASAAASATDPNANWVEITPPVFPEPLPFFVPGTQIMVTYVAGWDGPNLPDVKGVIKRAVARELTNRLDDAVGLKGFSTVRLPDGNGNEKVTPGVSDDELAKLSRYKNRIIV